MTLRKHPRRTRSLRRRFLLPFAIGVGLLGVAVGAVAGLGTRNAADAELANQARTAQRVFYEAMVHQQARLESEANLRAADVDVARAVARRTSRKLAGVGFSNTLSNRFDYVGIAGPRGSRVYSARGADWSVLAPSGPLVARVARGASEGGIAIAADGTPILFAAVPVRIPASTYGVIVVGEPIKAVNLQQIASPLDLTLELRTSGGTRVSSLAGAEDSRSSVRTFSYPLRLSPVSAQTGHLLVGLSTAPLVRATRSAAAIAAVVALGFALALLVLVAVLLDRAIVHPLTSLRAGIRQVRAGAYGIRLPLSSSRELAELADGFNRMAEMVGEQHGRLETQAQCDSLTGLANHACFHAALERAIAVAGRDGGSLAVLMLDIDHFKEINDEHGHPAGDRVLRAVGQRLRDVVRAADMAARLGGDEFALLLPDADGQHASTVAKRLRAATSEIRLSGARVSTSVGIACYPGDTGDPSRLVELADRALYKAKRDGRGRTQHHKAQVTPGGAEERAEVLAILRRRGAVGTVFQPIVSLVSGAVLGYEALARFPHADERGPDLWFAQAQRCGLGNELEVQAIDAARRHVDRPSGTFLALNLSPSAVSAPLVQAALPADLHDIVIEVTEQELVSDADALAAGLEALRRRGARIALDDAGAGYAGLQQLMRIEPDLIKLDRSLVAGVHADPARTALIESFVSFAARTGAQVCAEGIETMEELLTLARVGVDCGQGYVLARPAAPWVEVPEPLLRSLRAAGRDHPLRPSLAA